MKRLAPMVLALGIACLTPVLAFCAASPSTESVQGRHDGMSGMAMKGILGNWRMNREGSGTSWLPEASPMYMLMLPDWGRYDMSFMGSLSLNFGDEGGKRGDSQLYSNSMVMWMGRRETGGGILGIHLMGSLDPLFNGKNGYPDLFQTGETNNGKPMKDRQHPHDLIAEAAVSYSKSLGGGKRGFVYLAPVGEPALGSTMFLHRPSGMEIPVAPITHHWFDSSHITFGVATLGVTSGDKWKLDGSAFNGQEPDENRYDIDPISLNSYSGRVTFNPNPNWSFAASYGYIHSPEALEPGLDQHRLTASASYSKNYGNGDNLSAALLFGRNIRAGHADSDAWVLEGSYYKGRNTLFGRLERVDKDELVDVPEGVYTINKLVLGGVHEFSHRDGLDYGFGGYVGLYSFPKSLDPYYGKNPVSFGIFLRVRPGKM